MKRILLCSLFSLFVFFSGSRPAQAYFGFQGGLSNNDHYGYGLSFGLYTPDDFGLDFMINSNYENHSTFSKYGIQESISLFYDFNRMLKAKMSGTDFVHPYAKLGFAYGTDIFDSISISGTEFQSQLSSGPGILFGVGCDWKLNPAFSIGLDLNETILWLDGASAGATVLAADETRYGFNLMVTFKIYDFGYSSGG